MRAGRELEDDLLHPHGIVESHLAHVVEGADPIEITPARNRPVGAGGDGRRHRELRVEGRQERGGEEGVAHGRRGGSCQGEFDDEAVLERVPEAFDPALRLGAVGDDVVDPEGAEGPPDLRGVLDPLKLLGERPVGVVADEDPVRVRVDGRGEPDSAPEGVEEPEVARGILLGAEGPGEDRARRVVNRRQETARGVGGAKPGERTAVQLQEQACLRPPPGARAALWPGSRRGPRPR
jgi:hypothetical protein